MKKGKRGTVFLIKDIVFIHKFDFSVATE